MLYENEELEFCFGRIIVLLFYIGHQPGQKETCDFQKSKEIKEPHSLGLFGQKKKQDNYIYYLQSKSTFTLTTISLRYKVYSQFALKIFKLEFL